MTTSTDKANKSLAQVVFKMVCDHYGEDIKQAVVNRKGEYVRCRHAYFYLMSRYTKISLEKIGSFIGSGYDYATVHHAVLKIEKKREKNLQLLQDISSMEKKMRVILGVDSDITQQINEVMYLKAIEHANKIRQLIEGDVKMCGTRKHLALEALYGLKSNLKVLQP